MPRRAAQLEGIAHTPALSQTIRPGTKLNRQPTAVFHLFPAAVPHRRRRSNPAPRAVCDCRKIASVLRPAIELSLRADVRGKRLAKALMRLTL